MGTGGSGGPGEAFPGSFLPGAALPSPGLCPRRPPPLFPVRSFRDCIKLRVPLIPPRNEGLSFVSNNK